MIRHQLQLFFQAMASLGSKLFLVGSIVATGGIIYFVHLSQVEDRSRLHQGIVRDLERQQKKKIENLQRLNDQQELERAYRKRAEN